MTTTIDFAGHARAALQTLTLAPVTIDPDLARIVTDGGTIDLDVFTTGALDKIVLCTIRMHETGVVESTAIAWPDEAHNLPILWCNLTIVPGVMQVPVFDFLPMMDIVCWPEYAERYIAPLADLRDDALELLGDTVLDKAVTLPSRSIYTLSPYRLVANITPEGVGKIPAVMEPYIRSYCALVREAQPLAAGAERDFYLQKRAATRVLMKANDPGYPFMVDVFGEEKTHQVFDQVF